MIITYKQLGDIIKIIITGGACGFLYERRRRRIMGNNTKKTLIVVDMQNDFIDGALGTKEAVAIVENVKAKIREYADRGDEIIFTRDTHYEDYMETNEGRHLPVPHCIEETEGWEIAAGLEVLEPYTSTRPALDIQDGETSTFRMLRW